MQLPIGGTSQLPSGGTSVSDRTVQLPNGGTPLSSALPSPAWSGKSRRRRAAFSSAIIPHYGSTVSLDHVIRNDSTVSLGHFTKKSSVDTPSTDEVSLDLLSPRSATTVPLDH